MYLPSLPPANEVWGKVMFLHLSVNHSVHRGRGVVMPLPVMDSTPSWTATPLPPDSTTSPSQSTHGQYTSYWNAFLFIFVYLNLFAQILIYFGLVYLYQKAFGKSFFPLKVLGKMSFTLSAIHQATGLTASQLHSYH